MSGPMSAALRIEANALSDRPTRLHTTHAAERVSSYCGSPLNLARTVRPPPRTLRANSVPASIKRADRLPSLPSSLPPSRKSCFLFGGMPRQQHRKVSGLPLPFLPSFRTFLEGPPSVSVRPSLSKFHERRLLAGRFTSSGASFFPSAVFRKRTQLAEFSYVGLSSWSARKKRQEFLLMQKEH